MSISNFDRRAYIVDDDAALRSTMVRILMGSGLIAEEFDSAESFLHNLSERPAGCILLDVTLPGISGIQLLHRIRSQAVSHQVIMVSGCGDIALAVEAVKAGALDFVQKPFRADQLRHVVEKAFGLIEEKQRSSFEPFSSSYSQKLVSGTNQR